MNVNLSPPRGHVKVTRAEIHEPIATEFFACRVPSITHVKFCVKMVKGFWRGEGSNFGLFHWLASSPLQHHGTTVRGCDRWTWCMVSIEGWAFSDRVRTGRSSNFLRVWSNQGTVGKLTTGIHRYFPPFPDANAKRVDCIGLVVRRDLWPLRYNGKLATRAPAAERRRWIWHAAAVAVKK